MKEPDRIGATLALDEPVERVSMVSPARAATLKKMGIETVRDLVYHRPRRYVDLSAVATIATAPIGQSCTIVGTIDKIQLKKPRYNLSLIEIGLVDGTGVMMVTVFRQPWLMKSLEAGMRIAIAGKVEFNYGFKRMTNPLIDVLENEETRAGKVLAIHPATEKLSATMIRRLVGNALTYCDGLLDFLPLTLRQKYNLMSQGDALRCLHFPRTLEEKQQAFRRLSYEEVLLLQIHMIDESRKRSRGFLPVEHVVEGNKVHALAAALPFELTDEQQKARDEILMHMHEAAVMNHMLLGDVGTGKTVVAAFALAAAADTGTQALLMAPTEVLAQQHAKTLGPLLEAAGITWGLLTGSTSQKDREPLLADFATGKTSVLIGTHALLEDHVMPANLSLAIIDEQQRFGVDQRAKLLSKGPAPDALFLTATPIPRTLALALYGNLTLSYIAKRPHALAERTTKVYAKAQRAKAFDAARKALKRGEQVYVVCPLIEKQEHEKGARGFDGDDGEDVGEAVIYSDDDFVNTDVAAATKMASWLKSSVFQEYGVELLHGRMKSADKTHVMNRFKSGEVQVLVATTVIEVGVDVPNATVMIIEDADHFGLSQLHQLRGRVGRGEKDAQVYLIASTKEPKTLQRLRALETTDDGFALAALDLELRQEGDILGSRQHGESRLRFTNVIENEGLINACHRDAQAILDNDPTLSEPDHEALARELRLRFKRDGELLGG